jgi:hypothetical protein
LALTSDTFQIWFYAKMRFCRSTFTCTLSLLGAVACIFEFDHSVAQGGERGRSIEFSKTRTSDLATNVNQLNNKQDGLRDFEADLFKPFQVMTPKGSLDGVVAPPVRPSTPTISSKKARELLRKKKEWIYEVDPEMPNSSTIEELLNAPEFTDDGKDKKKMSPLDKYYEFLETRRKTGVRTGDKDKGNEDPLARLRRQAEGITDDSKDDDENSKKADEKTDASGLKAMFKPDLSASPFAPKKGRAFTDIFGLDKYQPTPDQDKEHREYMRQYQQLLAPNGNSTLGSLQPAPAFNPLVDVRTTSPLLGWDPFASVRTQPLPVPAVPNVPSAFNDLKSYTQPAYSPPLVQDTPKPLFPTTTPFEAPRRKF